MYIQLVPRVAQLLSVEGNIIKEIQLPLVFSYPVRKDLIRRAYLSSFTKQLQPKGRDPMAGKRTTAISFGINLGLARVPRIKNTGGAALAPNTVGGRLTFPPTPQTRIVEEINRKEMQLAIISAISATAQIDLVRARGHKFSSSSLPLIIEDKIVNVEKTRDIKNILIKLGVYEDIERASEKIRIRAGKGKMRGRKYKTPKSLLIVVHDPKAKLIEAARNLPGVDVIDARLLSVIHLAPGANPGRLTIYTESSISILKERFERRLFLW